MEFFHTQKMHPIVDLLHHTSFPEWLHLGFANPDFPVLFAQFAKQFARRYPWVRRFTYFNEPLPTTVFCGSIGMWYPHQRSDREFVSMVVHVGKAMCLAHEAVAAEIPDVQHVYVDTCEHHRAVEREAHDWAHFLNQRRFLFPDLITGRVGPGHPLRHYLSTHGFTDEHEAWFQDHAVPIDVLGLDYYPQSEMTWRWTGELTPDIPSETPRGFASVAGDYMERHPGPIMLTETNIRGYVSDRLTWLKFMEEQCEELVENGADFRGFCWYPSIDSTDWCNCCTKVCKAVDPQGIWYLDDSRWERHGSELSHYYSQLAKGHVTSKDLPAYWFSPPLDEQLRGYTRLMRHWEEWRVAA